MSKGIFAVKEDICTAPILKAPDLSKEFVVQTDASEHSIGAVLLQLNEEGLDQPTDFIRGGYYPGSKGGVQLREKHLQWSGH